MEDNGTTLVIYIFSGILIAIVLGFIVFTIMLKITKKHDNKLKGYRSMAFFKKNIFYKMFKKTDLAKQKKKRHSDGSRSNKVIVNFSKNSNELVPCIVQDANTKTVLMLGYMNAEALQKTKEEGKVTFFSRSKQRLWTKGETSGNFLMVKEVLLDCDNDTILIKVDPIGPVCHTGSDTCFNEKNSHPASQSIGHLGFLDVLEKTITDRKNNPTEKSYTAGLFAKGINKIAQKVGEEAVEIVIEAKDNNDDLFKGEAADLLFHYLILLQAKGFKLENIISVLKDRQK